MIIIIIIVIIIIIITTTTTTIITQEIAVAASSIARLPASITKLKNLQPIMKIIQNHIKVLIKTET